MKIIPIHYTISEPVITWDQIKEKARELVEYINTGTFHTKPMALSHCQVSERPFSFFVVHKDFVDSGMFDHQIIINAVIETGKDIVRVKEGCMSFPHRKEKNVDRYSTITVRYLIPTLPIPDCFTVSECMLKEVKEQCTGVKAELFQHECSHTQGKNIFHDRPKT